MKFLLLVVVAAMAAPAEEHKELLEEFRNGNVQLTAEVYHELQKTNSKNFLVCPISVQVVLALLQTGSKGITAEQLATGLHLPDTTEKIHATFTQLSSGLRGNEHYDLKSANKIYVKTGFQISENYKSSAVDIFEAEIQNIDFQKKEQAASEINKWIEEKTENKIKDMLKPDNIESSAAAILVNAIYFHGEWKRHFPSYATNPEHFYLNKEDHVEVEMMFVTSKFKYYEDSELNAKFLEMPYKGDDVTMTIVLPNDKEGLASLEANIADVLVEPQYQVERVMVHFPKFKIETEIKFKPILQAFGITDAFGPSADFTGIGENQDHISVSDVLQKTFIDVHEEGTTAAAATTVGMVGSSPGLLAVKAFTADHPFIFYLKSSAGILFAGRYIGVE